MRDQWTYLERGCDVSREFSMINSGMARDRPCWCECLRKHACTDYECTSASIVGLKGMLVISVSLSSLQSLKKEVQDEKEYAQRNAC